ncbi:MAG: hypothetical protein KBD60_08465 [Sterolibacterium sp.]|jgi:hypothetical protein|nr:hypothetical protein [Sterolibacterium sp.]
MQTPDFFNQVPPLKLRDPLADFLGATTDGIIEYTYLDVVKLAGHSCPTVAGAYQLTRHALRALYGDALPERGAIRVEIREDKTQGVTGIIANVVAMLTGASTDTGFKGIAGRFDRRNLLVFSANIPLEIRYTRLDTGAQVDAAAHLREVTGETDMPAQLQRGIRGEASPEEALRFGHVWQDRVRRILLEHGEDPRVFVIQKPSR